MIRLLLRKQMPRCFSTRIVPDEEWKELQEKINKINVNINDAMKELKKPKEYVDISYLVSNSNLIVGLVWSSGILFWCLFLALESVIERETKSLSSDLSNTKSATESLINSKSSDHKYKIDNIKDLINSKISNQIEILRNLESQRNDLIRSKSSELAEKIWKSENETKALIDDKFCSLDTKISTLETIINSFVRK